MDNVVESIFGLSPAQIQQRQNVGMMTAANNYASQDPLQRAAASMFAGGGMLAGAGAQAAGMMTPDMQQAQMTEQALQGLDTSDPKAVFERASQIQAPRLKLRLVQMARQIQAEQSKQALEAAHAKYYEANKNSESSPIGKIDPSKYTPDSIKAWVSSGMKDPSLLITVQENKQPVAVQEYLYAKENGYKGDYSQWIKDKAQAVHVSVGENGKGKPPTGYRWTADGGQEPIPGGPKDMTNKNKAIAETAEMKAKLVTGKVDEALKDVGFFSTGLMGEVLGHVPGTGAYDLDATLDTIKANLGFNELQAMRQASPTGGALGQIAVRELELLQTTIASLKQGQSKQKLKAGLEQIKTHYSNWKKAVDASGAQEGGGNQISDDDKVALAWANANPQDPRAPKIKAKLGIK